MEKNTILWNRDFSLLTVVQVLALFANTTLSFVLPLYILDLSGSPALFGLVLALAGIPLILMTPLGGVIADRGKKKRIIIVVDSCTTAIIVLYLLITNHFASAVPVIVVKLFALNVLQGIYMPTALASVRFLVPKDKLVPANAVANLIFSLANATGPALGTILYAQFGIFPVLAACGAIFAFVVILDLFLRIPNQKQNPPEKFWEMVKSDLQKSLHFMTKEKPEIGNISLLIFLFSIASVGMILVGLPVLVIQTLSLDMRLLALSQGVMMGGGVLGGILIGSLDKKLPISKAHWLFAVCSFSILVAALVLLPGIPYELSFFIVTVSGAAILLTTQIVVIQIMAYAQLKSPKEIVGKISAVVMALVIAALPVGQLLFGWLFERLYRFPALVLFAAVIMTAPVALFSVRHFRNIQ